MKTPREIACAIVDDLWAKGPECTREYAQDKIEAAIREAREESGLRGEVRKLAEDMIRKCGEKE
jgi:8-oxo-dGTP pyrophosphatase MutT (NUDIX family)